MSDKIQQYISQGIDDFILNTNEYAGEVTIEVKATHILDVCTVLKEKMGFTYLSDITGIDYYTDHERFGVAYNLINLADRKRLRILVKISEEQPQVSTVVSVWPAANWFEREVYDMFGILFKGHPDLRRIYMPEDFEYFPLRKEFPLIGIPGTIQMPEKDPPKEYK